MQNPENVTQLTNEAKLMSELSHAGIVKVHASETRPSGGGGGMEIVVIMEYCPGEERACAAAPNAEDRIPGRVD